MLNFEQWFEVEKITRTKISIAEQFKECWEYSAKKTKEDVEQSVIDEYEDIVSDLKNENGELECERDELEEKCDELERIAYKVRNITKGILQSDELNDDLKNKLKSILNEIDDYC